VKTRDTCNGEGYESVALIPLRHGPEIVGLLQLNDSRPSRFNKRLIVFLEGLAEDIGTVIESIDQEKRLVELWSTTGLYSRACGTRYSSST